MNIKKTLLGVLLAVLILLPIFSFVRPQRAQADFLGIIDGAKWVWEQIEVGFEKYQGIVGAQLANQTLNMYMNTFAHNIATELATGGPGGKPQFRIDSIKKSLQKAQDAAIGDFLGEISNKNFAELGINLCDPSLDVKLTATLALIDAQVPPVPKCDWRDVQRKWKTFATDFTDPNDPFGGLTKVQLNPSGGGGSWNTFWKSFSLEESDLGVYSKLNERAKELEQEAKEVEGLTAAECKGFADLGTTITEQVRTHCVSVLNLNNMQFDAAVLQSKAQLEIPQRGDATKLSDIIKQAANMFMNTFTSKLLNNYIQKGMWSLFGQDDDVYTKYKVSILDQLRGGGNILQPRGQDIFQEFKKVTIEPVSDFSFLESFVICPAQVDFRQPDNCVMDAAFLQAITAKKTIQEAIDEGIINGNASLIGSDDILRNNTDDCYRDAFCYHNLVKLRKANIIPIGWEIAANRSSVTDPVTLQEAIDCFEDKPESNCVYDISGNPDYNDHNPYYHLIDGDWVLKAPQVMCEAFIYSSSLESSESSSRQQSCVDAKFCLREDDAGNCLENQFGYCTKTENIWRFGADICQDGETYAGCLTFNNEDIGSNSYIEGSLDYCTSDEAGCKRYSQDLSFDGQWILTDIDIDEDDLFLNRRTSECSSDEAGCSEYIVLAADGGVNSVPNGDFNQDFLDGANTANPDGIPDGWSSDGAEYDGDRIANGYTFPAGAGHADAENMIQQIVLLPNTTYVFSAQAAQHDDDGGDHMVARLVIRSCDVTGDCSNGNPAAGLEGGGTCLLAQGTHSPNIDLQFTPDDEDMQRASCTFTTNRYVYSGLLHISTGAANDGLLWFDNVKVEMVSSPDSVGTSYSSYGDGGRIVINDDRFMCTVDEVGCQGYTPLNGDPMIPAVISQDDLCPLECVGYATFTQQPDHFDIIEGDLDVEYYNFIADTATQCPLLAVGCEEFTNLDEVAQGGEGREFYTYLRQCVLQNNPNAASYFTWEGSDVAGYQLKTWYALESDIDDAPCTNITPGSDDCSDAAGIVAACGPETPADPNDDPIIDPNCREFFDENNNSHFRLQDRVIFASDECHDYRRTLTATEFRAIPSLSRACSAAELGCREYYGNTANNIRNVFSDNFENGTYEPWNGGELDISNESLANNGHSMKATPVADPFGRDLTENNVQNKKSYQLSWWMKGDDYIDSITLDFLIMTPAGAVFDSIDTSVITDIEAGNWHYYSVSHYIDVADFEQTMALLMNMDSDNDVYLDNIILKEISNSVSVIKDSWNTPLSCNFRYDGYHLGCQSYMDTNNNMYNLKSFTHLCREEAIGCTPVIDTHNSTNPFTQVFHSEILPDGTPDFSEITIPADNVDYLVPDSGKYCNTEYKGCQMLGLPVRGSEDDEFNTVYRINDPDRYFNILCSSDALMCEEFQSDKGTYYFKDPINDTCTYQKNVLAVFDDDPFDEIDGVDQILDGWWLSDTLNSDNPLGCSDGTPLGAPDDEPGVLDSFDDLEYNSDIAALCPESKNLCTGFRDPADPVDCDPGLERVDGECSDGGILNKFDCEDAGEVWTPACQAYYYYNNEKIDDSSCSGAVDRNSGCILLYETNNWNADHTEVVSLYDTAVTYEENIAAGRPVSPFVCPEFDITCNNTANVLVKVDKDRQCAEWMSCKSSSASFDEDTNEYKIICDKLGICEKYDSENNITKCGRRKIDDEFSALTPIVYQDRTARIDEQLDWSDLEYTGMSVPDMLPIDSLISYNLAGNDDPDNPRLVFDICNWDGAPGFGSCNDDLRYVGCLVSEGYADGDSCDTPELFNDQHFFGTCWDETCWLNPRMDDSDVSSFEPQTRGYATPDAPFPKDISTGKDRLQAYSRANICENGILEEDAGIENGCEETYTKVTFGNSQNVRYYALDATTPGAICASGKLNPDLGLPYCENNKDCDTEIDRYDGRCEAATKIEKVYNWPGVCLEYDKSSSLIDDSGGTYNCNQWYPVQKIQGTNSLFDNYAEAGYYNPSGQDAMFCAVSEPYEIPEDRIYCAGLWDDNYCTLLIKVPAGTEVNVNRMKDYGNTIVNGYLRGNFTEFASTTDPTGTFPDGFGVDWIRNNNAVGTEENPNGRQCHTASLGAGLPSFFSLGDFREDPFGSEINVINYNDIETVFDAYGVPDRNIEFYYYDQKVKMDGTTSWRAGIKTPNYSLSLSDSHYWKYMGYTCPDDEQPCNTVNNCGEVDGPDGTYQTHEARFKQRYRRPKCSGFLGSGPRRHKKYKVCNPLPYNYYIKIDSDAGDTQTVCGATSCVQPGKGQLCLVSNPTWNRMFTERTDTPGGTDYYSWASTTIDDTGHPDYPGCLEDLICDAACEQCLIDYPDWPEEACLSEVDTCVHRPSYTVAGMTAEGTDNYCYNNPMCKFMYCVAEQADDLSDNQYCEEYGRIIFDLVNGDDDDPENDEQVASSIEGCLQHIYEIDGSENGYKFIDPQADPDVIDGAQGAMMGLFGSPYDIIDYDTWLNIAYNDDDSNAGCLENTDDSSHGTPACTEIPFYADENYCVFNWLDAPPPDGVPVGFPDGTYYAIDCDMPSDSVPGTACDGLECFQQCGIISQLDDMGDLSWLRTDIWWRNSQDNMNRIFDSWVSYYYDNNPVREYIGANNNVVMGGILPSYATFDQTPEAYGAGLGTVGDQVVVTRVPIEGAAVPVPQAATFFDYDNNGNGPVDDWLAGDAAASMSYLFYSVYNLDWNELTQIYEHAPGLSGPIYDFDINKENTFAGEDYPPQILQVCDGDNFCRNTSTPIIIDNGVTLNNLNEPADYIYGDYSLFTALKFFYHAHPDHMPITNIEIDWGDSNAGWEENEGRYKNSMEDCDPEDYYLETTDPNGPRDEYSPEGGSLQGFGGTAQACREGYKVFYHDYIYDNAETYECDGTGDKPSIAHAACYRPSVRITDRWGQPSTETFNSWVVIYRE